MLDTIDRQPQPGQESAPLSETVFPSSWLPSEFQTPEDLVQAYQSLKDKPALSFEEFTREYSETGALSPESYESLNKAGIPKDIVDTYVEGLNLLVQRQQGKVFEAVGGERAYRDMISWAEKTLSPEEIDAYNATLAANNINAVILAAQGLSAKYSKSQEPRLMGGNRTNPEPSSFQSLAELTAAMKDPRYAKDPAYRQMIEDKLARSTVL